MNTVVLVKANEFYSLASYTAVMVYVQSNYKIVGAHVDITQNVLPFTNNSNVTFDLNDESGTVYLECQLYDDYINSNEVKTVGLNITTVSDREAIHLGDNQKPLHYFSFQNDKYLLYITLSDEDITEEKLDLLNLGE